MNYNGQLTVAMSKIAKMFMAVLITIQFLELVCYLTLLHFINKHNKEMQRNGIISNDILKRRRRSHILSFNAQVFGFAIEISFLGFNLFLKLMGRNFFPPKLREYSSFLFLIIFCTNSTVQILASSDLRVKFFAMFSH